MDLFDLLTPSTVRANLKANSKKTVLQQLAAVASPDVGVDERRITEVLMARERLGTTGLGGGVAIPHARLPELKRVSGVFARLDPPVDFDALDRQPVDLVFMLLAPEDAGADHLKALAKVSRLFRDRPLLEKLRGTNNADAIFALLSGVGHSQAA
jgi:PTS system nitrogen regulatory IIA component